MSQLRDRRVRIYRFEDIGQGGFPSPKYTFDTERWAAVVHKTSREVLATPAPAQTIDAVLDFALQTDVRYNDLLIDLVGGERYFARGVTDQRNPDARIVSAERVPREVYATLNVDLAGTEIDTIVTDGFDPSVLES